MKLCPVVLRLPHVQGCGTTTTTNTYYLPLPLLSSGKAAGLLRLFSGDPFPSLGLFTGAFVSTHPASACLLLLVLLKSSKGRVCALAISQLGTWGHVKISVQWTYLLPHPKSGLPRTFLSLLREAGT